MKCTKCGIENTGPARFCGECGTPLAQAQKSGTDPSKKRLCDGCMGAFDEQHLMSMDGRELCTLCQNRERRSTERTAPAQGPRPGAPPPPPHSPPGRSRPVYRSQHASKDMSGWAIASLVMGFLLPLGFPSIITGFIAIRQIGQRPHELEGKGLAIGGIVLGFLGLFGVACVILAVVLTVQAGTEFQKTLHESQAQANLKQIHSCQTVFYNDYGRYATLDELMEEGYVNRQLNTNRVSQYHFSIEVTEDGENFQCLAEPKSGEGGHFFADNSGTIRYNATGPADETSKPYKGARPPVRRPRPRRVTSG